MLCKLPPKARGGGSSLYHDKDDGGILSRRYVITKYQSGSVWVRQHMAKVLAVVWGLAFLSTVPSAPFVSWASFALHDKYAVPACVLRLDGRSLRNAKYAVFVFLICFCLPLMVTCACYYKVYRTVRKTGIHLRWGRITMAAMRNQRMRDTGSNASGSATGKKKRGSLQFLKGLKRSSLTDSDSDSVGGMSQARINKERRLYGHVVRLLLTPFVAWVPYGISLVLFSVSDDIPIEIDCVTSFLAKCCVVFNPILYVVMNQKYKTKYIHLLFCRLRARNGGLVTSRLQVITTTAIPKQPTLQLVPTGFPRRTKHASTPALSTIKEMGSQVISATSQQNLNQRIAPHTPTAGGARAVKSPPLPVKRSLPEVIMRIADLNRQEADGGGDAVCLDDV